MRQKSLLITILTIITAFCLTIGIASVVFASDEPVLNGVDIKTEYTYNSEYVIPTGTIRLGTVTKQAKAYITFPDGTSVKDGKVTLSQEGYYTLTFEADFDGTAVSVEKEFSVAKNLFTVNKSLSTVVYGDYVAEEHDVKYGNTGEATGAYVNLAMGDVLTYNKVIDLSQATKNDTIINIAVAPETIGVREFDNLYLILTDAYDPENYVTISAKYYVGNAIYVSAKANCGQKFAGWEYGSSKLHYDSYGYPIRMRFDGNIKDYAYSGLFNSLKDNSLAISMDYAERQIHHAVRANQNISTVVTDLDNLSEHTFAWEGFTTGEVFLSVKCDGYAGFYAGLIITDVMGQPVNSVNGFKRSAPYVVNDFYNYDVNGLPNGVVNVPYPLFATEGKSVYFDNVKLSEKVYYDYNGEKREIEIIDGKFTPDKAGEYTVEYIVMDALRNERVSCYDINVVQEKTKITVTPEEELVVSGIAGNLIDLPEVSSVGGNGYHDITYSVKIGNKALEIVDKKFRPTYEGVYKVTILATDYLGDIGKYEYDVEVFAGNAPVYTEEIILPKYFVSGKIYDLPVVNAYNFTDGSASAVSSSITYSDGEAERKTARGTRIVPIALNNGDITTVFYTAEINGVKTEKQIDVPTIIARDGLGNINIENLFYTSGGNRVSADESYLTFVAGQSDSQFDYVNTIVAHGLDVRFSGIKNASNFNSLTIKLTDSLNPNQVLSFTYTVRGGDAKFYINGNQKVFYEVKKSITNENDLLSLALNELDHTVKFDRTSSVSVPIKTYLNGEEYQGFTSGCVYLTFELNGVNGRSELRLRTLNGKVLFASDDDFVAPKIFIMGSYGGNTSIGTVASIQKVLSCDVIDGVMNVKLTVKDPFGNFVRSTDGIELNDVVAKEYKVTLTEYGSYSVTFKNADTDNNPASFSYKINVVDEEKPIISIEKPIPKTGKVGEKITIPKITAIDNYDETTEVDLYLITSTGYMFKLETRAFIPDRAGIYTVRCYVKDKAGNLVLNDFDIVVE